MFQEAMAHNKYIRISSIFKFMYEIVKLPCTFPTKIYGTNVHSIEKSSALNENELREQISLLSEKWEICASSYRHI